MALELLLVDFSFVLMFI